MRETFAKASTRRSAGVMFISQADPGFSETEFDAPLRNPITLMQIDGNPDGFQEFRLALREETIAFGKAVAFVHGDSHRQAPTGGNWAPVSSRSPPGSRPS